MTDYGEYRQPSRGPSFVRPAAEAIRRSLTRNSSYNTPSISASTRSWVYSTQQNPPGPPPPLPIPVPSPVQRLRPLPNPHVQQRRVAKLHAVNPSESPDPEVDQERTDIMANMPDNVQFTYRKAGPSKVRIPGIPTPSSVDNSKDKKRTVMKGVAKSIRKLPKIMFGYGASKGTGLRRRGTLGTDGEGTSTTVTGITTWTGNTLPQYVSNPPTPVAGPIPSYFHHYNHQPMEIQMPRPRPMAVPVSGSPPPEVVRLDDVRRRHRPSFRIMPPSTSIARSETAHFFPGPNAMTRQSSQFADNPTDSSSSAANTAERTTVMSYHHDSHTPTPTPPLPLSRQISSNGPSGRLSYVGSEQIVRPTSFHGGSQAPPPIEIPPSITRMATPSSHLSYVSQVATVPSTLPLHIRHSLSQQRSQPSNQSQPQPESQLHQQHQPTTPPQPRPSFTPPIIESSEPIQSPISAHPQPTTDYLKMALSPPHSHDHTIALTNHTSAINPSSASRVTSFSQEPSFSNTSSPLERFFKTLYNMPWIAYERITVDYLPGKVGRVHGHALSREVSGRRVGDGKRGEGDRRRKRGTKDFRERERRREAERERRRRKEGRSRGRGHGNGKPVSWYQAVLSRSRRTSAELDLLGSDLGSHSSPTTTSLGAAIGLGLQNLPVDAASAAALNVGQSAGRERRQLERNENMQEQRTSHSRHHHHHHHRGRQRRKLGSIGIPDDPDGEGDEDDEDERLNQSPSPLIPAVYPFHYPPYPFTYPYTLPPPPIPPPIVSAHTQSQSQQHPFSPSKNTRGPRSRANQKQQGQQPLYSPGIPHPGYAAAAHAYQPMIAPAPTAVMGPQMYVLHSTSHGQLQAQAQTQTQMQSLSSSGPVEGGNGVAGGDGDGVIVGGVGADHSSLQPP